jgi:hypothetical protein
LGISHVLLALLLFWRILSLAADALSPVDPSASDAANDSESAASDDSEPGIQTRYKHSTFRYEIKLTGMKIIHVTVKI